MKEKRLKEVTPRDQDFAQWYTDICLKAELVAYSKVGGFTIFRPYGFRIWELIQEAIDKELKKSGHENVYMPMLIPESMFQKEKDHIKGFAPEVAWVTYGGNEELEERLCIRPTSEVLFCDHYSEVIESYKDLPKLYNQWCSVVRWEKTTRPFLRTKEFLWQEGHTAHANEEDARKETLRILDIYTMICEQVLALPVIRGRKTEKEKFAGAVCTYSIECMMHDKKALQAGTSHYFGDGFAKAFDIQYTDANNRLQYIHQTSWGVSTRLIGALIMCHGDQTGLVLPPKIAPIQVVIIPIASHKKEVLEQANILKQKLKNHRVHLDLSDKSPGWKFSEYEMKGVPLRVEIGPKDISLGQCVLVRRDTKDKIIVPLENLTEMVEKVLEQIQENLYTTAKNYMEEHIHKASHYDEFVDLITNKKGFVKAMWCGDEACENAIKEETKATSRNIPFDQSQVSSQCIYCGKKAEHMVVWGRAY